MAHTLAPKQFFNLVEAERWLQAHAHGDCTVVVHGDPYLCHEVIDRLWAMTRQYPNKFYGW